MHSRQMLTALSHCVRVTLAYGLNTGYSIAYTAWELMRVCKGVKRIASRSGRGSSPTRRCHHYWSMTRLTSDAWR
jgi:hypothetical protein